MQIGLTATPAEFIDRDTFKFFDCHDPRSAEGIAAGGKIPTFLYTFDKAVEEKYLVDKNVYAAQTKFQRQGIKGANMTEEEKEILRERGIDPDEIDYEGTDLERKSPSCRRASQCSESDCGSSQLNASSDIRVFFERCPGILTPASTAKALNLDNTKLLQFRLKGDRPPATREMQRKCEALTAEL